MHALIRTATRCGTIRTSDLLLYDSDRNVQVVRIGHDQTEVCGPIRTAMRRPTQAAARSRLVRLFSSHQGLKSNVCGEIILDLLQLLQ